MKTISKSVALALSLVGTVANAKPAVTLQATCDDAWRVSQLISMASGLDNEAATRAADSEKAKCKATGENTWRSDDGTPVFIQANGDASNVYLITHDANGTHASSMNALIGKAMERQK